MTETPANSKNTTKLLAASALTVALLASLTACGNNDSADTANNGTENSEAATLKVSDFPVVNLAGLYAGVSSGAFDDAGLNVEPTTISGAGATIIPALQSGSIDVAASNVVSVLQANAAGDDIKCFATITRRSSDSRGLAMLAGADSGVSSAADLAGKSIGVNALASANELIVRSWLEENGVSSDDVNFVVAAPPQMPQILNAGEIDAGIVDEPYTSIAIDDGAQILEERPHEAVATDPLFDCWVATSETIENRSDDLQAFVDAIEQENQRLNTDPEALIAVLTDDIQIDADVAANVQPPFYGTDISGDDVVVWHELAEKYGVLSQDVDPQSIVAQLN